MKLRNCVLMGLFCGLETIEECVDNYIMHYTQCIAYTHLDEENKELNDDLVAYKAGDLVIDWDELRILNNKALKEYEDSMTSAPCTPIEEIDFEF
jgi:hypothetical protein